MTSQSGHVPPPGPGWSSGHDERQAFADMYDAHAAYVFDYCHSVVGNRDRAAAASQATLIAAHSLVGHLQDQNRLRAWLMALARRECQDSPSERAVAQASAGHTRRELAEALAFIDATDDDVDADDSGDLAGDDDPNLATVRTVLQKLSAEQREILSLVYRYGIDTFELPAILGIDAASVAELLTDAEARFIDGVRPLDQTVPREPEPWTDDGGWVDGAVDAAPGWDEDDGWAETADNWADDPGGWADGRTDLSEETGPAAPDVRSGGRVGLAWLAVVPLIALPASVWRRTSRVVLDPKFRSYRDAVRAHADHLAPDGFPAPMKDPVSPPFRRLLGASALLAVLLLAPAGLGWAGYAEFANPVASKTQSTPTPTPTSEAAAPSTSAASSASSPRSKASAATKHVHKRSTAPPRTTGSTPASGLSSATSPQPGSSSPSGHHSAPTSSLPPISSPPTTKSPSPSPSSKSATASASEQPESPSTSSEPSAQPSGGGPTPSAV